MRPAQIFLCLLIFIVLADLLMFFSLNRQSGERERGYSERTILVAGLGLTDLCIATEARYTRHPALTDYVVPFMDYPGEMEHFPTGSFWVPQRHRR